MFRIRASASTRLTGCSSAAQGYFDKPLRDLSPAECAFLASLPQAPSRLNPFKNFKAVQSRQKFVLDGMVERGWLASEKRMLASEEKILLQRFNGGFEAPHAIELACSTGSKPAPQVIRTTILPVLQSRMESVIAHRLSALRDRHVTQAAAVVIENKTGRVLALAGSRDFFSNEGGQINGAWSPHSAGSAVKPFTYLLALQRGFTPASIIPDLPIEFSTPGGIYRPEPQILLAVRRHIAAKPALLTLSTEVLAFHTAAKALRVASTKRSASTRASTSARARISVCAVLKLSCSIWAICWSLKP
jgi:penicillin-binding protein 1C